MFLLQPKEARTTTVVEVIILMVVMVEVMEGVTAEEAAVDVELASQCKRRVWIPGRNDSCVCCYGKWFTRSARRYTLRSLLCFKAILALAITISLLVLNLNWHP